MSNKEIKDRLSDGEGAPDERTDMEEQIDAVMDRLTDPPDDEEDLDDLGEYDDSKEEYEDTEPDEELSTDEEAAEDDEESTDDAESYDEAGEVYEERLHPARHKSARPGPVVYVPLDDMDEQPVQKKKRHKKKHKGGRIFGLLVLMVLVVGGCAYAGASYYFSDRFFEGTWINGVNCSQMTAYEVENLFKQKFQDYSIEVSSRGLDPQTIAGDQIDYQYLSTGEVLKLLQQQKPYEWIKGMYEQKSYTVSENTGYNKTKLQEQLKSLNCAQAENQTAPENAYVAFQDGQFVIVPETEGSKLNIKQAYQVLDAAVESGQTSVNFADTPEAYVSADVTQNDQALQSALEACNNYTRASITYTFGDRTETLDGNTIKDWLQFDEKGQLVQDDASFTQHVKDFVAQLASEHNTVGTTRSFNTTSGRTVSVYGSAYGWKIDQDAEAAQLTEEIRTGTQTTREPVYSMRANAYGYNDIGSTYIEVDLSSQHMYYYQGGSIIFDSDIVSGDIRYDDRATPPGIFTLYYKKSPDVLRGAKKPDGTYEYETSVTYWMPFNGGIGFHDATWQAYFGGDRYTYAGSHGCINMPLDAAATLYSIIDTNVPIVCFY